MRDTPFYILYVHGYHEKETYEMDPRKAEFFGRVAAGWDVYTYYPTKMTATEIQAGLLDYYYAIEERENVPVIMVGTSMGGYHTAQVATMFDIPYVLMNPALNVDKMMATKTHLPQHIRDSYIPLNLEGRNPLFNGLAFVELGDELLDHSNIDVPYTQIIKFDGGNHRFLQLDLMEPYLNDYARSVEHIMLSPNF